jgi:hypothetical protein
MATENSKIHRIPLQGTPAADFFIRQDDEYSCGAACMATVARLFGQYKDDYNFFRDQLAPDPGKGVHNDDMISASRNYLPFDGAGEGAYTGGVAIANIIQKGEGHFVVFLCREKDQILYYDPYEHELVQTAEKDIEWVSETDKLQKWAINFKPVPGNSLPKWLAVLSPQTSSANTKKLQLPLKIRL